MTAREPSAVEVIAEALSDHAPHVGPVSGRWACQPPCGATSTNGDLDAGTLTSHQERAAEHRAHVAAETLAALKAAGFVVATRAAIRAMSVQEQAELIGGEVETYRWHPGSQGVFVSTPRVRVRGPWREVQP